MPPTVGLKTGGSGIGKLNVDLARLAGNQVLVGIPEDKNSRRRRGKRQPIGNAQLLYILTNGSPVRGLPATPIIEPAIEAPDNRERIEKILRQAAEAELAGQHQEALDLMARAGTAGANAAKRWFTDPRNGWPANALSTINRKLDRLSNKKREAAIDQIVAQKGDTTGVVTRNIDTGDLRRNLTYVVVDGGSQPAHESDPKRAPEEIAPEGAEGAELGEAAEIALL